MMIKHQFILIISILLFAIALINCTNPTLKKVNQLFNNYKNKMPGASILVIKNGEKVLSKSFGMGNIEENIPISENTNFRLASVTKQFTAMSIMMLVEEEKLSLEDNLKQLFPEFPDYGKNITLKHLLQHNSGLIDYEDIMSDTATEQVHDDDVLQMMMDVDSTYFEPGTQFRYSNSAYAVLVIIIEKIAGVSFNQFLEDRIFKPLDMKNSIAFVEGKNSVPNRAFGYNVIENSIEFSDQSTTSAVLGDGGIYSSVADLYKWDQALYTEKLIHQKTFEQIVTPGLKGYGFGWRIDQLDGHYRMSHTGSTCGFRNVLQRYPEDKLTVIILTNRREPDVENLADEIAKLYFD